MMTAIPANNSHNNNLHKMVKTTAPADLNKQTILYKNKFDI